MANKEWREEFDEVIGKPLIKLEIMAHVFPHEVGDANKKITNFISNLLKEQQDELCVKVEGLKLGKPKLPKGHFEYKRCCEDNDIYNSALKEVLKIIK